MVVSKSKSLLPKVYIPDSLARWPYPRLINVHYATVGKESTAWAESLGAFSPKAQHAFNRCDFSRLASLGYPMANKGQLRSGCDLMSLFFIIDEYTDASNPSEVQQQKDAVMDALRNPHKLRPQGECVVGEAARQFWELAIRNGVSERCRERFISSFDCYLEGVVRQAVDRSGRRIRDTKSYFDLRRETIGTTPTFALLEQALDIPDEVMSLPAVQDMVVATTDLIILTNDIASYNIEQSRGDDAHNIITVVMNEFDTDVNGAMLWVQDYHARTEQKFHAALAVVPRLEEPLNAQVKEYCHGLGNWVRANECWSFESGRYFGTRGLEVMKKRWMSLMPKRETGELEIGPTLVDSSLL